MKLLPILAIAISVVAQTPARAPLPVVGTARINGISGTCTIPKNGGTCKWSTPAYDAPVTATVTMPPSATIQFKCNAVPLPNGQPDLTKPLTSCVVVVQ